MGLKSTNKGVGVGGGEDAKLAAGQIQQNEPSFLRAHNCYLVVCSCEGDAPVDTSSAVPNSGKNRNHFCFTSCPLPSPKKRERVRNQFSDEDRRAAGGGAETPWASKIEGINRGEMARTLLRPWTAQKKLGGLKVAAMITYRDLHTRFSEKRPSFSSMTRPLFRSMKRYYNRYGSRVHKVTCKSVSVLRFSSLRFTIKTAQRCNKSDTFPPSP